MQFPDTAVMNIVMIYDPADGTVLLQERPDGEGSAFPGGHLEIGESLCQSCVREVWEETGLTVSDPVLCGLVHWSMEDGRQEFIWCYRTCRFTGTLRHSEEGGNRWVSADELNGRQLIGWFREQLPLFFTKRFTELSYLYDRESGRFVRHLHGPDPLPDPGSLPAFTEFPENRI